MFLPKRYQQLDVDLCCLTLLAKPSLTSEEVVWMDAQQRWKIIQPWAQEQAEGVMTGKFPVNVEVKKSSVENAGDGVFCIEGAKAGSVVCVHPGTIHTADAVRSAFVRGSGKLHDRIFEKDLKYCVQLFDGTTFDAGPESEKDWTPHPYAVAHKCNHPPKGALPNVMKCPFWWDIDQKVNVRFLGYPQTDEEKEEENDGADAVKILDRVRIDLGLKEAAEPKLKGLGFVTLREIQKGEELFVNYRFNPKIPKPDWYFPVDVKEDEARWS